MAAKAWEIFKSSTTDEKRQLIGYIFSNLELKGDKLQYTLHAPFDLLVNIEDCQNWHPLFDTVRTKHSMAIITLYNRMPSKLLNTMTLQS